MGSQVQLVCDNPHRPMDLRAPAPQPGPLAAQPDADGSSAAAPAQPSGWQALLQAGSAIAAEARAALKASSNSVLWYPYNAM